MTIHPVNPVRSYDQRCGTTIRFLLSRTGCDGASGCGRPDFADSGFEPRKSVPPGRPNLRDLPASNRLQARFGERRFRENFACRIEAQECVFVGQPDFARRPADREAFAFERQRRPGNAVGRDAADALLISRDPGLSRFWVTRRRPESRNRPARFCAAPSRRRSDATAGSCSAGGPDELARRSRPCRRSDWRRPKCSTSRRRVF